ncbi:MAG: TetR/AcrR family transcriptional regulator [Rhizomicrobium sp.]|jgi:AcrR family transcriptional regulator
MITASLCQETYGEDDVAMAVKSGQTASRSRPRTEAKLQAAVARVLVKGGFGALSPTAIAHEAGVDKMLIYRYFGGLEALIESVTNGPDFFPTFEEICGGDPQRLRAMALPERAAAVLETYTRLLRERPVALELMVWELVERNRFTAIMETARETVGLRLTREIFDDIGDPELAGAVLAVLSAGLTYLALRQRKITWYNGINLRSDEGWAQIQRAVRTMVETVAANRTHGAPGQDVVKKRRTSQRKGT